MDIDLIRDASLLFLKMIEQHPELCPHEFRWTGSDAPKNGKKVNYFRCRWCGEVRSEEVDVNG